MGGDVKIKENPNAVNVRTQFVDRGLVEYVTGLYNNKLVFLRETAQNSADEEATFFSVLRSGKEIVITDDGRGMSQEFCLNEFGKFGRKFKSEEKTGEHGIGRGTLWSPIVGMQDGKVVYTGHIEIVTNDGKRSTRIIWEEISKAPLVYDLGPTQEHGTQIRIIKEKGTMPDLVEMVSYMEATAINVGMKITLNQFEIKPSLSFQAESVADFYNNLLQESHQYRFSTSVKAGSEEIVVAERGISAKTIYGAIIGGVINFLGPVEQLNYRSIMPLSREGSLLNDEQVSIAFYRDSLPYLASMPRELRKKHADRMITLFSVLVGIESKDPARAEALRNFAASIFISDNKTIGEEVAESKGKIVWANEADSLVGLAERKGYKVLLPKRLGLSEVVSFIGIPHVNKVGLERNAAAARNMNAIEALSPYLVALRKVAASVPSMRDPAGWLGAYGYIEKNFVSGVSKWRTNKKVEFDPSTLSAGIKVEGIAGSAFIGNIPVFLMNTNDTKTTTFRLGNGIGLNMSSGRVFSAIHDGRADTLVTEIIHHFVHILAENDGHDHGCMDITNRISAEVKLEVAKEQELAAQGRILTDPPKVEMKTYGGALIPSDMEVSTVIIDPLSSSVKAKKMDAEEVMRE